MKLITSSLAFLTSLPFEENLDEIKRNLWFLPFAGLLVGVMIAAPLLVSRYFALNTGLLGVLVYILVEGMKKLHGIGKLGDAAFVSDEEKRNVLKERFLTSSGVIFIMLYIILLFLTFFRVDCLRVINSQFVAKYAVLYILTTSKTGRGNLGYLITAEKKNLIPGFFLIPLFAIVSPIFIPAFLITFIIVYLIRNYSHNVLGGVDNNVLFAVDSVAFLSSLTLQAGIPLSIFCPLY